MESKYVVFENFDKKEIVATVPVWLNHDDIKIRGCADIVSAGFVLMGVDDAGKFYLSCYGESLTLNLSSRGEQDEKLFVKQLFRSEY